MRPARRASWPPNSPGPGCCRGILATEERELYKLRLEKEGEARRELELVREEFEVETRNTQNGKLCATPFGIDIVGITEAIALVGGVSARQRKVEVERLNEQLRKINITLRQQARAGTVYAPGASRAAAHPTPLPPTPHPLRRPPARPPALPPTPTPPFSPWRRLPAGLTDAPTSRGGAPYSDAAEEEVQAMPAAAAVATATLPSLSPASISSSFTTLSMEEDEMSPDQLQCKEALRAGAPAGAAAGCRLPEGACLPAAQGAPGRLPAAQGAPGRLLAAGPGRSCAHGVRPEPTRSRGRPQQP
jgi:hypothetical protein